MSTDAPSDELSPEDKAAWAQSGHLRREFRAVHTIQDRIYIDSAPSGQMNVEPLDADIQAALDAGRFSAVIFSEHGQAFSSQLWMDCGQIPEKYIQAKKAEHAARIAGFVTKGWKSPLRIRPDGVMMDGTHRLKAAKFKGLKEIECWIQAYP
jgi:hypothetical protein